LLDGLDAADRRRQRVKRDAFGIGGERRIAAPVGDLFAIALVAGKARPWFIALRPLVALRALVSGGPFGALRSFVALRAIVALIPLARFARFRPVAFIAIVTLGAIVVAAIVLRTLLIAGFHLVVVAIVFVAVATLTLLLFEAGAALAEDAVIMVRELQIIFSLDAVAPELRVAGHALVFFQKLRGIATLTIVLAVAVRPSTNILGPLAPAAATAATLLSIIDQMLLP